MASLPPGPETQTDVDMSVSAEAAMSSSADDSMTKKRESLASEAADLLSEEQIRKLPLRRKGRFFLKVLGAMAQDIADSGKRSVIKTRDIGRSKWRAIKGQDKLGGSSSASRLARKIRSALSIGRKKGALEFSSKMIYRKRSQMERMARLFGNELDTGVPLTQDFPKVAGVPFLEQDRPDKVKEIFRALERDHPDWPVEVKARIASRKGKSNSKSRKSPKHGGPAYKAPLHHKRVGTGDGAMYVGKTKSQRAKDAMYKESSDASNERKHRAVAGGVGAAISGGVAGSVIGSAFGGSTHSDAFKERVRQKLRKMEPEDIVAILPHDVRPEHAEELKRLRGNVDLAKLMRRSVEHWGLSGPELRKEIDDADQGLRVVEDAVHKFKRNIEDLGTDAMKNRIFMRRYVLPGLAIGAASMGALGAYGGYYSSKNS
jgi:hypothetical protein